MSNPLKKHSSVLKDTSHHDSDYLELVKEELELSNFNLPELPELKNRKKVSSMHLKSEELSSVENDRYRHEKDLLLDQISKLHIDIENKKNELECANSSMQDKIVSKQLIISGLENQESKYLEKIQKLSEEMNLLKIDLESSEHRIKVNLDDARIKESELKSSFNSLEKSILESSKKEESLFSKIDSHQKKLHDINIKIEHKKNEFNDASCSFETLQVNFDALKLKYESLVKKHNKINEVIQDLENYERELSAKRELAHEKLNNEIERNKLRFDVERQTQFKNLNNQLYQREKDWEKEFESRNVKREAEFNRFNDQKEMELNRRVQQAENEVNEIHAKARAESSEIRESAEKILKEAYIERQRLLDEGSREKMKAMTFVEEQIQSSQAFSEKIKLEANSKLQEARDYFKETESDAKKVLESARSKGESILRKADIRKRSLLRNAQLENEQITKKMKSEELEFLKVLDVRKTQLNNYLKMKRERALKNIELYNKEAKAKEEKLRTFLLVENEKVRRKQLKKVVQLKDILVKNASDSFESEKQKIRDLRKVELEKLYHDRSEVIAEIKDLKQKFLLEQKNIEEEKRRQFALKEQVEEQIFVKRKEELENDYLKKTSLKLKEIEDIQKKNDEKLKAQILEYIKSLKNEDNDRLLVEKLDVEINSIFQNSFEHKKGKMLESAGLKHSESKSKDIFTFVTKYVYKILIPLSIVTIILLNGFGSRDAIVALGESAYQAIKDSSESKEAAILKEEQDKKTFSPVLTEGFKDSYVDNILYTKDFVTIYESDKFQNDWLLAAYQFISNELELNEEVAIKFISAEGAFIRELAEARKKIDARFAKDSIDKMKVIESNAFRAQMDHFVTVDNWNAFQAYRKNFFIGRF